MRTPVPKSPDEKIAFYLAKARLAREKATLAKRWDEQDSWEELARSWEDLANRLGAAKEG
jgi:hypothetical protein